MAFADTLRERTGIDIREIAGATLRGELPVSNDLVNRLIAERLRDHPQIASVRVEALADDAVAIHLVPRARLLPPLRVAARIERQPDLPRDPTLVLRWSMPAAGPLQMFAAPILSYFKAMPAGIRMDGDRIAVDAGQLLRARGLGEVLAYTRRAAIHTRPGGFVVQVEFAV